MGSIGKHHSFHLLSVHALYKKLSLRFPKFVPRTILATEGEKKQKCPINT
jgi:hypothetical protein